MRRRILRVYLAKLRSLTPILSQRERENTPKNSTIYLAKLRIPTLSQREREIILGDPPEVIIQPDDIVFSEVTSSLHFNEDQQLCPGVFDPVRCTNRNVNGLT